MHLNRLSCTASRKCTLGNIIKLSQPIHTFIKPRLNSQHSFRKLPWSALSCRGHIRGMAPRPELEKQYMSSGSKPKKTVAEPRPSASILLISPTNEILLLHRVQTSSSFPSAHVFPGGNLSASQDGEIPSPSDEGRHRDGKAYRVGAIRECFEESGILLAKGNGGTSLLEVEEAERERARKEIHAGKLKFGDWVKERGGVMDTDGLIPFTRWITPTNLPKRFTTQMYIYFLPLTQQTNSIASKSVIPVPTSDGGVEHTAALFAACKPWLEQASKNEIILFPPQFYLMHLLSPFLTPSSSTSPLSKEELQGQRDRVLEFLTGDGGDGKGVKWGEKVMSPIGILMRKSDGRSVLGLEKPGPELKDSGRGGDEKRVVLVKFSREGPRDVEVRERVEVLREEKEAAAKL
ncbi:hypothetical protein V8E51_016929 [Hyaloscypha variabilis]